MAHMEINLCSLSMTVCDFESGLHQPVWFKEVFGRHLVSQSWKLKKFLLINASVKTLTLLPMFVNKSLMFDWGFKELLRKREAQTIIELWARISTLSPHQHSARWAIGKFAKLSKIVETSTKKLRKHITGGLILKMILLANLSQQHFEMLAINWQYD